MLNDILPLAAVVVTLTILPTGQGADNVQFSRDIAPILASRCLGCHNSRISEGRYALDTLDRLLKSGDSEDPVVVPGKPDESQLFLRVAETDADLRMPQQDDPLDRSAVEKIRLWIAAGADFGDVASDSALTDILPARDHPTSPETYRLPVPVFAVAFAPDGNRIVTGGWHELLVWDTQSGSLMKRVGSMPQRIHTVTFSPDGQLMVVAGGAPGDYGEIQIRRAGAIMRSAAQPIVISDWNDLVLDVSFSVDGRHIVACGADNSVRCYSIDGREQWRTKQHVDWVTGVNVTDYSFFETRIENNPDGPFEFTEFEQQAGEHIRQFWNFGDSRCIVREANFELEISAPTGDLPVTYKLTRITISGIGKTYKVKREQISADELQSLSMVLGYLTTLADRLRDGSAVSEGRVQFPLSPFVVSSSYDRTARVFALRSGRLFTTYKGHRREYGPLRGLHRVHDVLPERGTRRVWSAGEGQHIHGWNPVVVRDEDGTAADMEQRFSKEYSTDLLKHELSEPVFRLVRHGDRLIATTGAGRVHSIAAFGENARYSLQFPAEARSLKDADGRPRYDVCVHAESGRVVTAGGNGSVTVHDSDGTLIRKFLAAPLQDSNKETAVNE